MIATTEESAIQTDWGQLARGMAEFRPFAYYDKHLDCIRVQMRDCSVIENRKNKIFTVLEASHSNPGVAVGFTMKGVRHLFEQLGLSRQACYKLADIMDKLVMFYPEKSVKEIADQFAAVLRDKNLEITLENGSA